MRACCARAGGWRACGGGRRLSAGESSPTGRAAYIWASTSSASAAFGRTTVSGSGPCAGGGRQPRRSAPPCGNPRRAPPRVRPRGALLGGRSRLAGRAFEREPRSPRRPRATGTGRGLSSAGKCLRGGRRGWRRNCCFGSCAGRPSPSGAARTTWRTRRLRASPGCSARGPASRPKASRSTRGRAPWQSFRLRKRVALMQSVGAS